MMTRDRVIGLLITVQCGILVAIWGLRGHSAGTAPEKLQVSAEEIIGAKRPLLGRADTPYTLVEFGDYQCPPCAAMFAEVERLLPQYPSKLHFQFRHYPLTQIHPLAQQAALIAEKQRLRGRFWETHKALYALNTHLTPAALYRLNAPDNGQAEAALQQDIRMAEKIGITGTPTFLLCRADGTVFKLRSLDQVAAQLH